jgi:predicted DNA binding CopG/RHH family protein
MKKNTAENEKRLGEIRKEMAALGPVLFGDMSAKTQSYKKVDGTVSRQKAQSLFRFAKTGGKMTMRIPSEAEKAVKKMIANGKKYTTLREEYERILTALSLEGALKKTPTHAIPVDGEPIGGRQRRSGRSH